MRPTTSEMTSTAASTRTNAPKTVHHRPRTSRRDRLCVPPAATFDHDRRHRDEPGEPEVDPRSDEAHETEEAENHDRARAGEERSDPCRGNPYRLPPVGNPADGRAHGSVHPRPYGEEASQRDDQGTEHRQELRRAARAA